MVSLRKIPSGRGGGEGEEWIFSETTHCAHGSLISYSLTFASVSIQI